MFGFEAGFEKLGQAVKEARQRGLPIYEVKTRYIVTSAPMGLQVTLSKRGVRTERYHLKPLKAKRKKSSSWAW